MKNIIKNACIIIGCLLLAIFKLVLSVFPAFLKMKGRLTGCLFWLAIVFQPSVVIVVTLVFLKHIVDIITSFLFDKGDIIKALIVILVIFAVILLINLLTEFIFCICGKKEEYKIFISVQKKAHNYMMILISMFALYTATGINDSKEINLILLFIGIIISICIFVIDIYDEYFYSQGIVGRIYDDFIEQCKHLIEKNN